MIIIKEAKNNYTIRYDDGVWKEIKVSQAFVDRMSVAIDTIPGVSRNFSFDEDAFVIETNKEALEKVFKKMKGIKLPKI